MAQSDDELFRAAMSGATRLGGPRRVVARPPRMRALLAERPIVAVPPALPPGPRGALPDLTLTHAPGLDRATDATLRRGRLEPDSVLDLHGMTVNQAERALQRRLALAVTSGWRSLLVVTGKGLTQEDGTVRGGRIRAHFLVWLNLPHNRAHVHAVRQAHPRHGGSGAFYVLVRRRRER